MRLQQIEFFLSCATLHNFRKAARYHNTDISTISRQISALETELGVKLLERKPHHITMTGAGAHFCRHAESILESASSFRQAMIGEGCLPTEDDKYFRLGCYPLDNMFCHLVDQLEYVPFEQLGKACKIQLFKPGKIVESVLSGSIQLGVDSKASLRQFADLINTRLFCRMPFHLLVEQGHPLYGRTSIPLDQLLDEYPSCAFFLPDIPRVAEMRSKLLYTSADVLALGEFILKNLPFLFSAMEDSTVKPASIQFLPEEFCLLPFAPHWPIKITEIEIFADYMLFWKKDSPSPDIDRFLEILDFRI